MSRRVICDQKIFFLWLFPFRTSSVLTFTIREPTRQSNQCGILGESVAAALSLSLEKLDLNGKTSVLRVLCDDVCRREDRREKISRVP
jgi:hypothetical protein